MPTLSAIVRPKEDHSVRYLMVLAAALILANPAAASKFTPTAVEWAKADSIAKKSIPCDSAEVRARYYLGDYPDANSTTLPRREYELARQALAVRDADVVPVLVGSHDPLGWHNCKPDESLIKNTGLAITRANGMNDSTGKVCIVSAGVVRNAHRGQKGVYLILVRRIPTAGTTNITEQYTYHEPSDMRLIRQRLDRLEDQLRYRKSLTLWGRPSVGGSVIGTDPMTIRVPSIGLSVGTVVHTPGGQLSLGLYAMEGMTFQPVNQAFVRYGLQLGDDRGWALRTGYRSAWTEANVGDGYSDRRCSGGELGLTYGTKMFGLSIYGGLGHYADLRDRHGQLEPSLSGAIDIGPSKSNHVQHH